MDMIPYLVTVLDEINDEVIKDVNTELEEKIDEVVRTQLQEDIYVPTNLEETNNYIDRYERESGFNFFNEQDNRLYIDYQTNILYGLQASNINQARECSIYRGTTYN